MTRLSLIADMMSMCLFGRRTNEQLDYKGVTVHRVLPVL